MIRLIHVGMCVLALTGANAFAQTKPPPAYLVAEYDVTDTAGFRKWGEQARALATEHGGQFLAVQSKIAPVIGEVPKNATIVRFENMDKAKAYVDSAEYKALAPERDKAARFRTYIVEGVAAP